MIEPHSVPRHSSRTAVRVVEGRALIVVIDDEKLHTLNGVATRIWELCDGRDVSAIVAAIVTEFEVDNARAQRDVMHFLSELSEVGALELEDAA